MKRRIRQAICLLLVLMMSVTLLPTGARADADTKPWTIAVYLCGTDLESNQGSASDDLCEMLMSDFDDSVANLFVLTGGTRSWDEQSKKSWLHSNRTKNYVKPNSDRTEVYQITGGSHKMSLAWDYQGNNLPLSDKSTLVQFLKDVIDHSPSEHMMVILWDHGGGPLGGAEKDEYKQRCMPLEQIAAAFKEVNKYRQDKFVNSEVIDVIGFDCCLMGNLEIAYALRGQAKYMIASEETEWGYGWNYAGSLGVFTAANQKSGALTGAQIGKTIIDNFSHEKTFGSSWAWSNLDEMSLALYDLNSAKVEKLATSVDTLGSKITDTMNQNKSTYAGVLRAVQSTHTMAEGRYGLVDAYSLAAAVANAGDGALTEAARDVLRQLGTNKEDTLLDKQSENGVILYRGASKDMADCVGMSVYYPTAQSYYAPASNYYDDWEDYYDYEEEDYDEYGDYDYDDFDYDEYDYDYDDYLSDEDYDGDYEYYSQWEFASYYGYFMLEFAQSYSSYRSALPSTNKSAGIDLKFHGDIVGALDEKTREVWAKVVPGEGETERDAVDSLSHMDSLVVFYMPQDDGTTLRFEMALLPVEPDWQNNRFVSAFDCTLPTLNGEFFTFEVEDRGGKAPAYYIPVALSDGKNTFAWLTAHLDGNKLVVDSAVNILPSKDGEQQSRRYVPEEGFRFHTLLRYRTEGAEEYTYVKSANETILTKSIGEGAAERFYAELDRSWMPTGNVDVVFRGYDLAYDVYESAPVEIALYSNEALEASAWAAEQGIASEGMDLNAVCSRAQMVTFLWNSARKPAAEGGMTFTDVPAESDAAKAVAWAAEKGVTLGVGDGKFAPDAAVNRAQALTFLYRRETGGTDEGGARYYDAAAAWAAENGILDGELAPNEPCSIGDVLICLYRTAAKK